MRKICKDCGFEKRDKDFYKNKRAKDGLDTYCKDCKDERVKRSRKQADEVDEDPVFLGAIEN